MYKVILIDDETIIVEGLKKVVDWTAFDCEVVATASDARQGAVAVRQYRPDILFTDIKMPDMDGLTMLAGLKSEFPRMQITVLTGYRDFEYAKRAINLGVTRFLLKPSRMHELEEALRIMTKNLSGNTASPREAGIGEERPEESPAGNLIVRSAVEYIRVHYAEKLTLTVLTEKTYVSPWYLSKLLNRYTGESFSSLLNNTRIEKAKELLKDPSFKIHEISEMLGFNDVTHFSRIFKKTIQMSPLEYRNSYQ
ncbi:putative response regulatory protein [Caprobacter fermentans]|uniref:Stage 0 sporulation protein A homolog n=1 Tax=Caproicibacter fermentans TaxID=2576756 RepID=A0A6N8HWV8_9FIRM|nr:response regulator [Caproicibacter fermentans]MVB10148.1 putative response regulatory protein [Caproicibacter fermentans]